MANYVCMYTLEQRWDKWTCDRLTENADFDLGRYVNKQNCRIVETRTHTLKSRRTQNELLFGADFGPEA